MEEQKKSKKIRILGIIIIILTSLILGMWGGIIISGKNISDFIGGPKPLLGDTENKVNNKNIVTSVNHEIINTPDAKNYMIIDGIDEHENKVWTYKTTEDYVAQVDLLEFLQVKGDTIYINEHAKIVAIDKQTGKVIWENSDYQGGSTYFKFDEKENLYLTGAMNPDLLVINSNGQTVRKIEKVSDNMYWPTDLTFEEIYARITFPVAGFSGDEDYNYVYFELEDLNNTSNKILSKEIIPEFLHTQINGFEDIKSFVLESNGDVYIEFEPDTELNKKYGDNEKKYKIADGAKNIYALFSGNGGYGEFIIVKNDGTMYLLSSYDVQETGNLELKDSKLQNVDYVISIKGFDAYYFCIVNKNGNVTMY